MLINTVVLVLQTFCGTDAALCEQLHPCGQTLWFGAVLPDREYEHMGVLLCADNFCNWEHWLTNLYSALTNQSVLCGT